MIDLRGVRLRSNPHLRLVPYDRLQAPQIEALRSLSEDPDFFGILMPPADTMLPVKAMSRDAALLFLALAEPACLPHLLTGFFGADADQRVRQLVLDSVLQVEHEGRFICGCTALELLGDQPRTPSGLRIAQLSTEAIAYAAALDGLAVNQLAARLYRFNVLPSTPALQRQYAEVQWLPRLLFETGTSAARVQSNWRGQPASDGWLTWSSGDAVDDPWLAWSGARAAADATYKLYVSPALDDLPAVFAVVVEAFVKARCARFKVGSGAWGVLRPDKLVAYFGSLDQLLQAAESIRACAGGARAHGVPFSAPIDSDGLLSWGMDPPRLELELAGREHQSWRQWLTERIAIYAAAGRQSGVDVQAFVRQRVALDGVDPSTWSPNLALWRAPVGSEQRVA